MAQIQTRLLCTFSPQEYVHFSETMYFYLALTSAALLLFTPARSSCTTIPAGSPGPCHPKITTSTASTAVTLGPERTRHWKRFQDLAAGRT